MYICNEHANACHASLQNTDTEQLHVCVCVCASTLHELRVHVHYRAIISGSIRRHHFLCVQTPCLDVTNKCINTSTKVKVIR